MFTLKIKVYADEPLTHSVGYELIVENRGVGIDLNPVNCYGRDRDRYEVFAQHDSMVEFTGTTSNSLPIVGTSDIKTRLMEFATLQGFNIT